MKFVISTKPPLTGLPYFQPIPRENISRFVALQINSLDEIAVVCDDLLVKFGDAGEKGMWSYSVNRLTTGGEEGLSYTSKGKFVVWAHSLAEPTYTFEVAFRDSDDAMSFKLAYC